MNNKELLRQALSKDTAGFNQKIPLTYKGVTIEIAAHSELAVGQIFDQLPLTDLTPAHTKIDYHVHWVDNRIYGFSTQEWREDVDQVHHMHRQSMHMKKNFLAICDSESEGKNIVLIASYEADEGVVDFLNWLVEMHSLGHDFNKVSDSVY